MDLNVYCCIDGRLLLVPDCCAPSIHAQHRYGPLSLVGTVALDDTPRWDNALARIDQHTYALVDDAGSIDEVLGNATFHTARDPALSLQEHAWR